MNRSQQASEQANEVSFGDIWNILRRQRWVILAGAIVGMGVGILFTPRKPPVYEATTSIRVDTRRSSLSALDVLDRLPTGNQITTEIEVLRSRELATAVVDSLGLQLLITKPETARRSELLSRVRVVPDAESAKYRLVFDRGTVTVERADSGTQIGRFSPRDPIQLGQAMVVLNGAAVEHPEIELSVVPRRQAVDQVVGALNVKQPSRDADIIHVTYHAPDPELARDVPNVLAKRFLALRRGVQQTESGSTAEFLRQQLDTVATELANAENQLQAFRENARVIDPAVEGSTEVRHLAQLQAERGALEAERSSLAQLLQQVQASGEQRPGGPSPYRQLMAFPSLMRNQLASELIRSLSALENERANLLTRRDRSDPDVQVLQTRIDELETQLRGAVTTYLQALTNQVAAIDANLAQSRRQLDRLPANEAQLARLSRRTKGLEEIHGTLQTRLKQVEITQAAEDPSVRVVDPAVLPLRPIGSKRRLIVAICAVFGLVAGVGVGFVREYRDHSVRTRGDLQVATGIPVLGLIPRIDSRALGNRSNHVSGPFAQLAAGSHDRDGSTSGRSLLPARRNSQVPVSLALVRTNGPTPLSDAYERLHTNILFSRPGDEARTILFTSPLPADGKTTTAANYAVVLAQRGLRVLLIDGDLRRGAVHAVFNGRREPGLVELLEGLNVLAEVVRTADVGNGQVLSYIPAGATLASPGKALGSAQLEEFLRDIEPFYDRVIIDSPPLNIVADAAVLARHVDGVVVVVRAGATPFEALLYAAEQFRSTNMPVIGTVLNDIDFERDAAYDGAYRSYSYGASYYSTLDR